MPEFWVYIQWNFSQTGLSCLSWDTRQDKTEQIRKLILPSDEIVRLMV